VIQLVRFQPQPDVEESKMRLFFLGIITIVVAAAGAAALGWLGKQWATEGWNQWRKPKGTRFSRMTDPELKETTLRLVTELRHFLLESEQEDREAWESRSTTMDLAKTEEEKHKIWTMITTKDLLRSAKRNAEYERRFQTISILLRDELLSRLHKGAADKQSLSRYEHPTNPLGMGEIADDLEKLGKSL